METNNELSEESFQIPSDLLLEFFAIIVREKIKHQVIQVIENRSITVVLLTYDKATPRHEQVITGLKEMIDTYHSYRHDEAEDFNWKDKP